MIVGGSRRRFANNSREAVTFYGGDREAGDFRFAAPAFDGAVLVKVEDENLFAPLGKPRADGGTDGRCGLLRAACSASLFT